MQLRYVRFNIYVFRCLRMLWRAYRKGVPIHRLPEGSNHKHSLWEIFVKFMVSSWKVSGYKEEPFPDLFPSKEGQSMKFSGAVIGGYLVILLLNLVFWGAIIAVAWHFIAKFW